jgi:hypothetical protein
MSLDVRMNAGVTPPQPRSGLTRPRRRWIWALVALATATIVVVPVAVRFWLKAEKQQQADPLAVYRGQFTAVQIQAPGGSITVRPGRAGQVSVAGTLQWVFGKPAIRVARIGRTLQISARCPQPNPFEDCQASLGISVPANLAVHADVGAGSANLIGLAGPLHVAATSGTITMTDISGQVWARATAGNIAAPAGISSPSVDAAVGRGSIMLDFDSPPDRLVMRVGAGAAHAIVPAGTHYRVSLAQAAGSATHVASGLKVASAAGVISGTVGGAGTLSIGYPPGAGQP